jgi:hypothetical protein
MRYSIAISFIAALFVFGCGSLQESAENSTAATPAATETTPKNYSTPAETEPAGAEGGSLPKALGSAKDRALCYETDTGDNVVLRSQTFAINFEPFEDSCFVTSHNPEFDDPPMESEIGIYRDGERLFDFPSQFNGATFGCWVDAAAFQDLNDDGLIDIIVIGKCSGKSAAYNENMIYVNTGKEFATDADANLKASDHETVAAVSRYVRANKTLFFK